MSSLTLTIGAWCNKCNCSLSIGAADATKDVEATTLDEPSSGFLLEKVSISGGKIITAGATIAVGFKESPVHVTRKGYIRQLRWISQRYVVLWDDADKRGWLVNGTSALLHLVRASLGDLSKSLGDNGGILLKPHDLKDADENKPQSAWKVLISSHNRELRLYAEKRTFWDEGEMKRKKGDAEAEESTTEKWKQEYYTFQDLVEERYHILEQIIDHQQQVNGRNGINLKFRVRNHLEGWDFVDLVTDDEITPRVAPLDALGWGWVDFVRSIGAITLFGCGFGDIIQPEVYEGMCPKWKTLPKGQSYLAASGFDLAKVKFHRLGLVWHCPVQPVTPCRCQDHGAQKLFVSLTRGSHHDPVQFFWPKKSRHILPLRKPETINVDGAYVFGHNFTWSRYRWKAQKDDNEEDLEDEDAIPSICIERTWSVSEEMSSQSSNHEAGSSVVAPSPRSRDTSSVSDATTPSSQPSSSSKVTTDSVRRLPERLARKRTPSDPSFVWQADQGEEEGGQDRRTKRRKQREADART